MVLQANGRGRPKFLTTMHKMSTQMMMDSLPVVSQGSEFLQSDQLSDEGSGSEGSGIRKFNGTFQMTSKSALVSIPERCELSYSDEDSDSEADSETDLEDDEAKDTIGEGLKPPTPPHGLIGARKKKKRRFHSVLTSEFRSQAGERRTHGHIIDEIHMDKSGRPPVKLLQLSFGLSADVWDWAYRVYEQIARSAPHNAPLSHNRLKVQARLNNMDSGLERIGKSRALQLLVDRWESLAEEEGTLVANSMLQRKFLHYLGLAKKEAIFAVKKEGYVSFQKRKQLQAAAQKAKNRVQRRKAAVAQVPHDLNHASETLQETMNEFSESPKALPLPYTS